MIALSLRASAALTCVFALLIAILHAIPYDVGDLRAFFLPQAGCAAPCFMGIRPQTTTHDQALAILRANVWVSDVTDNGISLRWTWNGRQPGFVSDPPGDIEGGQVNFVRGRVYSISLSTATNWGEFFGAFGSPDHESFAVTESLNGFYAYLVHSASYAAYGFEVESNTLCPFKSRADLWYSPVSIVLPEQPLNGLIPISRGC